MDPQRFLNALTQDYVHQLPHSLFLFRPQFPLLVDVEDVGNGIFHVIPFPEIVIESLEDDIVNIYSLNPQEHRSFTDMLRSSVPVMSIPEEELPAQLQRLAQLGYVTLRDDPLESGEETVIDSGAILGMTNPDFQRFLNEGIFQIQHYDTTYQRQLYQQDVSMSSRKREYEGEERSRKRRA
jgi:hypothetical protein